MSDDGWTPWKLAAIGMAIVMVAALITGLVVANWTGPAPMLTLPAPVPETAQVGLPGTGRVLPPSAVPPAALEPVVLPEAIDEACNEYASQLDKAQGFASRAAYAICVRARGYRK
ncbi:MAG: hypothetical protein ACREJV_13125 [Candidatus Rokuibacteriota bacterium]